MDKEGKRPSPEQVEKELKNFSRDPFRDALARMLQAEPNIEDVRKFAVKWPDRWTQVLSILGKLSGYSDKLEVEGSLVQKINEMSDAQLMQEIKELRQQLKEEIRREMKEEEKNAG